MRRTDILIAGGGLAGSTAAAMLGRAGIHAILVDPHTVYPPDLRCEKLDGPQAAILQRTGIAEAVLRSTTLDGRVWVARFGRLVEKRASDQYGVRYDALVAAVRAQIPSDVPVVYGKVSAVALDRDRQHITLSNGDEISARLVVMANGLNVGFRQALGITRREISKCHSITAGFDMEPVGRPAFEFPALTYYPERVADRMAYLSVFPIGGAMRANLMVYRSMDDPWLRQLRHSPVETLHAALPRLARFTGAFAVPGPVQIRPADLYASQDYLKPGVVLVGDAFGTSCPAAGTGTGKVFTDVERLCNVHIPRWLATDGMGEEKIAAFYEDPVKQAYDRHSIEKAYSLRSLSTDPSLPWLARRWARFAFRRGLWAVRGRRDAVVLSRPSGGRAAGSADPGLGRPA